MGKKKGARSKATAPKPLVPSAMKSLKRARRVTSEFHRIQREMESAELSNGSGSLGPEAGTKQTSSEVYRAKKQKLERELHDLGGRQAYQEASVLATSRHRTCKWIFAIVTKLGLRPAKTLPPLKLLEVGAVNTQLLAVPWLAVRAIDIKAQHPRIEQMDFFDLQPEGCYDAVVLSMVLNCVSSPLKRGRMLSLVRKHLLPSGHMFLMIPRRCVENSPHCTIPTIVEALSVVGLKVVETKLSPKVAFFCAQRVSAPSSDSTGGGSDGSSAGVLYGQTVRGGGSSGDDDSTRRPAEEKITKLMKRFADPPRTVVGNTDGMKDTFAVCFERGDLPDR
mmetsp:Transcript_35296/g.88270  ORF Transcript_35296/g.88270 Transcript_35296/m.88270 type:complete len:335 (-) Transcript_35296:111-1115(-)|eukprot:CAMPEP_0181354888 /NCGR_PEP_ID=MMETSP1106-20121128/3603_1 /TAXON_ID=81844 /ORGANISM="Mantoniella antarctica, Strain SL-175" /LENGTH=334 /DNA_ID=CAMNT_0023467585 /DNA_START=232 /DNA_END=1236 /DNA_ORIENTATION=-